MAAEEFAGEVRRLLGEAPLFASLAPETLEALADAASARTARAGEVLFSQGEPGTSLVVVVDGRLEVAVDGRVVRHQSRGDVVGELALLTGRSRSATVRVVRDSRLAEVDEDAFSALLRDDPSFARGLVQVLAERLVTSSPPPTYRRRGVMALIGQSGTDPGDVRTLSVELTTHLPGAPRAVVMTEPETETEQVWGADLDRAESTADLVVLVAGEEGSAWAGFCRRQADRVLAVRGPRTAARARSADEVVLIGGARGVPAARLHPIRPDHRDADVARLARRLTGDSIGLVLSGGGARGIAHLGVVQALAERGIHVDRWGGTSMGALIAALMATGIDHRDALPLLRHELVDGHPFRDYHLPRHSLIRAERARAMLERLFGARRIEDLPNPYFCVSVDLHRAEEIVHRDGPLVGAVGASMAVPGVAPPIDREGRTLVDGGVLNNLPVDVMADDDEGPVIAVDVMRRYDPAPGARPGIVDVIGRSMVLGSWRKSAQTLSRAAVVVTPDLGSAGMFDWRRFDELVARGRAAAEAALDGEPPTDP